MNFDCCTPNQGVPPDLSQCTCGRVEINDPRIAEMAARIVELEEEVRRLKELLDKLAP